MARIISLHEIEFRFRAETITQSHKNFEQEQTIPLLDNSPIPRALQEIVSRNLETSKIYSGAKPEPGLIVEMQPEGGLFAISASLERVPVLLNLYRPEEGIWAAWIASRDKEYASWWDLVLGPEDDPRDFLCEMVQAWNPVMVRLTGDEPVLGRLSSERLKAVRLLAEEYEQRTDVLSFDDRRPGVHIARELSNGTGVVTGTPLADGDRRTGYQTIYRSVANMLTQAAACQQFGSDIKVLHADQKLEGGLASGKPMLKRSIVIRWSGFVAAILSAVAFGAITMRLAMVSGMEGVRSEGKIVAINGQRELAQTVAVITSDPSQTINISAEEATRLHLNFSVRAAEDGYDLIVEGLVPYSDEQTRIKQTLGIRKSAGGNLLFQIRRKSSR